MARHKKTFLSALLIVGSLTGGSGVALAAPSGVSVSSQQARTAHITVRYQLNAVDITQTYAVSPKILRDEQTWLAQQQTQQSVPQVADWLSRHGGKLDRQDGPALFERFADGSSYEMYCRNGLRDRQDGPAFIEYDAKGAITYEAFYEKGHFIRDVHPALPTAILNGPMQPPAPGTT